MEFRLPGRRSIIQNILVSRHRGRGLESSLLGMTSHLLSFEAWRRGRAKGTRCLRPCHLPKHFVEAGFSRAALRGDRHYPGAAQKIKTCRPEGRLYESHLRQLAVSPAR